MTITSDSDSRLHLSFENAPTRAADGGQTPRLTDCLAFYLEYNEGRRNADFLPCTRRSFRCLIDAIGNKPIAELSRADGRAFVAAEIERGIKTTSVRRALAVIAASLETYLREHEIERRNPFRHVRIRGEGKDAVKRRPFTNEEMVSLRAKCRTWDDDVRWLIALLSDTGARLAEVAGLALDDIKLEAEVPHVVFKEHPWRPLKTEASTRIVPLVGAALWAAMRILQCAKEDQHVAFPRYTKGVRCNADSASAAIGKWMKTGGLIHSAHELRHTMADRLRAIQCPDEIRHAIGGWTTKGQAAKYGNGYGLTVMCGWLLAA